MDQHYVTICTRLEDLTWHLKFHTKQASDRISSRNGSVEEGVVEETRCSAKVWQNVRSVEVARRMQDGEV